MASDNAVERLGPQYENPEQQLTAARFGMWVFLATELLFFTGFFVAYTFYRSAYWEQFHEAGQHMKVGIGTANTFILITSSLFVAWALHFIREDRKGLSALCLLITVLLGIAFLVLKGVEYAEHVREGTLPGVYYRFEEAMTPGAISLYTLYWLMTGLHAIHVTVGIVAMAWIAFETASGTYGRHYHTPIEVGGMYWHFVDLIWVFLYPLLYLL